jgi:hypothetical protein
MPRKSLHSRLLAIALLFSVALSHLYGAWHGVAHLDHLGHDTQRSSRSSVEAVSPVTFSSTTYELVAGWSALQAACEDHSESDHQHSCVSLDGLCAGLTPVSAPVMGPTAPPSSFFLLATSLPLRGHLAWVHASARAPPGISIV